MWAKVCLLCTISYLWRRLLPGAYYDCFCDSRPRITICCHSSHTDLVPLYYPRIEIDWAIQIFFSVTHWACASILERYGVRRERDISQQPIVSSSRNHHRNIIHHQTCRGHTQRRENTREQTLKYQNFPESRIHKSLGLVQCSVLSCFFRSRKRRFFATIYLPILDMRRRRITINAPSIRSILAVRQWYLTRLWWPSRRTSCFSPRMNKKMWSRWCQECSHHDHHGH